MRFIAKLIVFFILGNQVCVFNAFSQFQPTDIPNLTIWLAADSNVSVSSGKVTQWNDLSGNNNHFIAPLVGDQPNYVAGTVLNGFTGIVFDGTDRLESLNTFSFSNATVFVVSTQNTGDANFGRLIDHSYNLGFWLGKYGGIGGGFIEGGAPYGNYNALADNKPAILSIVRNGATSSYFLNSSGFAMPTRTTAATPTAINKISLGSTITGANLGKKNIYEVIIYSSSLTASDRLAVETYLRDKYTADFTLGNDINATNLCAQTLTAPNFCTNLLWSTGETTNTIQVASSGTYTLTGTDVFGYVRHDTINVNFPQIYTPIDTFVCAGSSESWDTGLGLDYDYLWNDGSSNESISINSSGQYFVKVTDSLGCFQYSDTLEFVIDNYAINASLGIDTVFCSGNYIELISNVLETVSYDWQGNISAGQPSNYQVFSTGDYWLESTNVNGCVAQDTIHVIVSGTAPTAIFTGQNRCLGVANVFTDGSAGIAGDPVTSWSWDFGDGQGTSIAQNPSYTYAVPGIYTVELYALSQGGCGSYHTEQVQVYTPPTASYTHTGSCSDQVMQFTNQSTAGDALINQYAWNFGQPSLGAINVSSVQNPYRSFPTGGTFPMTLTVTDAHLCADDTVMQITVNATPIIDVFAADACTGAAVQFTNNTVVQAPATYLWNFGDNTTSILPLPSKQYPTEGQKTITVKVTAANGCFTTDTIQMTVHPVPVASFDLGPHCKGAYTEVQSTSSISTGSIADLYWVVNLSDTLYGDTTGYEIMNLIQQQVQLFVSSDFGCTDDYNMFFDPEGAIGASFTTPSTIVACGDTIPFMNTSLGATAYAWSFGNDSISTASNPTTVYDCSYQDSSVMVMLIASNSLGCIDTTYTFLWVGEYAVDLQVDNIYFQANGSNAILGAELKNKGTAPITSIDLNVFSEAGFVMNEAWTGNLLPNQTEIYVFTNQPAMTLSAEDEILSFYCVQGTGYANTQVEPDLSNNEVCKNIESSEVILKPLYPNPTGSIITMSLIVPESAEVEADLVDDQGRVVKQLIYPYSFVAGEYTYVFDLAQVANGTYALRFTVNGKTELHRLVVLR